MLEALKALIGLDILEDGEDYKMPLIGNEEEVGWLDSIGVAIFGVAFLAVLVAVLTAVC